MTSAPPQVSSPPQTTQVPAPQQQQQTPSTTAPASSSTTPAVSQSQTPNAPSRETAVDQDAVRQLMDMGFPEEEAKNALRAAMGNSDVAVEFLMNGIPPHALAAAGMGDQQNVSMDTSVEGSSSSGGSGIEQLRNHPQLNELRRLVQSNPASLSQVLEAIGQYLFLVDIHFRLIVCGA